MLVKHRKIGWQFLLASLVLCSLCESGLSAFVLTADVSPTVGLTGFETYRITATSDMGNIVGFDFSRIGSYGISGPINQVNPYDQPSIFHDAFLGNSDPSQDTQFLLNGRDVLTLFPEESGNDLHAVFAVMGDQQLTIGNSVPFLQIATSAASDVTLRGSFVIRRPNDELFELVVETRLSDLLIGAAPLLQVLPVPPPLPEPVVITPPVPEPLAVTPPAHEPRTPPAFGAPPIDERLPLAQPPVIDPGLDPTSLSDPPLPIVIGYEPWWNWINQESYVVDFDSVQDLTVAPMQTPMITNLAQLFDKDNTLAIAAESNGTDDSWNESTTNHLSSNSYFAIAYSPTGVGRALSLGGDLANTPEPASAFLMLFGGITASCLARRKRASWPRHPSLTIISRLA